MSMAVFVGQTKACATAAACCCGIVARFGYTGGEIGTWVAIRRAAEKSDASA